MFKMKFQTKILITTICSIVLLTVGLLTYFYSYVTKSELEKSREMMRSLRDSLCSQFDSILYNMDRTALQIAANPFVVKTFGEIQNHGPDNYFLTEPLQSKTMRDMIASYNFARNINLRVCILNESGDFVSSGSKQTLVQDVQAFYESDSVDGWRRYFGEGNFSLFVAPRDDPYNRQQYGTTTGKVFSVVRPIKDTVTVSMDKILGYVEVQKETSQLDSLFSALPENAQFFVLDESGNVLLAYGSGNMSADDAQNSYFEWEESPRSDMVLYPDSLVSVTPISSAPLSLVFFYDYRSSDVFTLGKILVCTTLGILAFFCIGQFLIIRRLTAPLKALHSSIQSLTFQDPQLHMGRSDELVEIEDAFNQTLHRLQLSMTEEIEAKTREVKSFLMAMQAQINPHFLHNILSVISMSAEDGKCDEISGICCKLSEMLRFTASYDETSNTLASELEYTGNYLSLMKVRYEDMLEYSLGRDEAASVVPIPKLVIQPLVENCFKHAFPEVSPPWKIMVNAYTDDRHWFVEIVDNGCGFDPDFLERFEQLKTTFSIDMASDILSTLHVDGMCIPNIFVRLKILYRDELVFDIHPCPEGGSIVRIGGPIL